MNDNPSAVQKYSVWIIKDDVCAKVDLQAESKQELTKLMKA